MILYIAQQNHKENRSPEELIPETHDGSFHMIAKVGVPTQICHPTHNENLNFSIEFTRPFHKPRHNGT